MLKSDPAECVEELEQTEKCMLPECRKWLQSPNCRMLLLIKSLFAAFSSFFESNSIYKNANIKVHPLVSLLVYVRKCSKVHFKITFPL